ncbi:MAG TPA: outer membrane beta-barrel protein [Gemmatimonadales bacterium]
MSRRAHEVLTAAGLAFGLGLAGPAQGQVRGIPVYNSGIATGIAIYGDVGFPDTEAGKGTSLAVSGRAGFGQFGATAMLSSFNPDRAGDSELSVGGTLNYRVFGGPLIPLSVTLQGGIGYSKPDNGFLPGQEVDELRFPVGVGFALTIPNPALAIKPWIAPRIDIVQSSADGQSSTESDFGLGGGVELNLLSGLGVHAAYDRVFLDGGDPSVFGFGAHYTFRIPGL